MAETEELIQQKEAVRIIESYRKQFAVNYPDNEHVVMAQLAAFPIAVTIHLLYQLWANFKNYTIAGNKYSIPVLAVNDCILSRLFRQTGKEIYEMDAYVREELKKQYKAQQPGRKDEVASFLYRYADRNTRGILWENYYYAQKQAAMLELQPEAAVQNILSALENQVKGKSAFKGIGIANLISTLSKDKDALASLVKSSLDNKPVINKSGQKTIVITDQKIGAAQSVMVDLPEAISQQLQAVFDKQLSEQKTIEARKAKKIPTKKKAERTVYSLFANTDEEEGKILEVFSDLLIEKGLMEAANSKIYIGPSVKKPDIASFIIDTLQHKAQADDIVLIHFASYDNSPSDRFEFPWYGNLSMGDPSNQFVIDTEFRGWLSDSSNDPTIVFIADGCCNSKGWIDTNNPKHIALTSAWPLANGLSPHAGITGTFTSLLKEILEETQFICTYETLYSAIAKRLLKENPAEAFNNFPMFLMDKKSSNNFFLQNSKPDEIRDLQNMLSDLGGMFGGIFKVVVDGILGAATTTLINKFREMFQLDKSVDILPELKMKKALEDQSELKLLWITKSAETASYILQKIKEKHPFVSFEIVETATLLTAAPRSFSPNSNPSVIEPSFIDKLNNAFTVFIGLNDLLNDNINNQLPFEKIMRYSIATGKQVYGISENRNRENIKIPDLPVLQAPPVAGLRDEDAVYELQVAIEKLCLSQGKYLKQTATTADPGKKSLQQRIAEARNTGILDLSNMELEQVPKEIFSLSNLKQLDLSFNKLRELPDTIGNLKMLNTLLLNNNLFGTGWPHAIFKLRQLKSLNISDNQLNRGTDSLVNLKKLEILKINRTGMRALDAIWLQLPALKEMEYEGNQLLNVPIRLKTGKHEVKALREYFKYIETNISENRYGVISITSGKKLLSPITAIPAPLQKTVFDQKFYEVKDTAKLFEIICKNYSPNIIFYIKDESRELRKQFGEYDDRVFNLLQYLRSFHLSLNLVLDMPNLNIDSTWTDLVNDRSVNFAAVRNNNSADPESFVRNIFQQLFLKQVRLSEFLKSSDNAGGQKFSKGNTNAYDLFYNLQRCNDISIVDRYPNNNSSAAIKRKEPQKKAMKRVEKKPVKKAAAKKAASKKAPAKAAKKPIKRSAKKK